MMRPVPQRVLVDGDAGPIEAVIESPSAPRGIALIAHPHPLFGGTMDNKVVHTLARTFAGLGYVGIRPNFRGVGASAGVHDHGIGETEDLLRMLEFGNERYGALRVVLAGFSFGAFVQSRVARRLHEMGRKAQRIVMVAPAAGLVAGERKYVIEPVPTDSLVIHGESDDTVPLANVLDWARPQELPIVVVPGADHFFHRKLHVIRDIIQNAWRH